MLWVQISIRAGCATLCDKVCQWLASGRWFSPGPPVSSTNKTDRHDITEILLKVALNTIKQTNKPILYHNMLTLPLWSWQFILKNDYSCNPVEHIDRYRFSSTIIKTVQHTKHLINTWRLVLSELTCAFGMEIPLFLSFLFAYSIFNKNYIISSLFFI
jgi:hypothetical protein